MRIVATFAGTLVLVLALAAPGALAQPLETETPGATAELLELRQAGGLLRLAIRVVNTTAAAGGWRFRRTVKR